MPALLSFLYGFVLLVADAALIIWMVKTMLRGGSTGLFSAALFLKLFLLAGGLYLGLIALGFDPVWLVAGALFALTTIVAATLHRARRKRRLQERKNSYPVAQK